jgi:D-alanyl-D-alanine dipeptidase
VRFPSAGLILILAATVLARNSFGQERIQLIDIKSVDPTIVIDLRYAGSNNIAGRPLYPAGTRALIRPEVAQRSPSRKAFSIATIIVSPFGTLTGRDPCTVTLAGRMATTTWPIRMRGAGSLHSWGPAVDATLTDMWNRPVSMPTDFDDFTPAATWVYLGTDPSIRAHLITLQIAMREAGFYGLRSEWWHFTIELAKAPAAGRSKRPSKPTK